RTLRRCHHSKDTRSLWWQYQSQEYRRNHATARHRRCADRRRIAQGRRLQRNGEYHSRALSVAFSRNHHSRNPWMSWFTRRGLELVTEDLLAWDRWLEEMRAAGLNLLIIHTPRNMSELVAYAASDHVRRLSQKADRFGIDIEWAPHALKELLPREHFVEHPE